MKACACVQGVIAQIMGVPPSLLRLPEGRRYPPTVFMHMPRDTHTAAAVKADIAELESAGGVHGEVEVKQRAVTAELLQRSPRVGAGAAEAIVTALHGAGLLVDGAGGEGQGGHLKEDPRRSGWREAVQGVVGEGVGLAADASDVPELLNLAYAGHEIVSDGVDAALEWLMAGGKGTLPPYVP